MDKLLSSLHESIERICGLSDQERC